MNSFQKEIEIRWSDVDQNRHLRHSVYYDYGAHVRIRFIMESGFSVQKLGELQLGPILFHEECHFIKEVGLPETVTVNLLRDGAIEDFSKWILHHEMFNQKGEKVAHLKVKGAWINTARRKLTRPPEALNQAFASLPLGEDYQRR